LVSARFSRHGRACPGHPSWHGATTDGRDKPGHDGEGAATRVSSNGGWYYQAAMQHLGAAQVVQLVAITGYYVMMAMLIGAFRFELPEGEAPAFTD
jgi:hypothetical protein